MEFLQNILFIVQIFFGVITMILILLQNPNENSNIIVSEASRGGNMGSSRDEKLAKYTKIFGAIFIVLTVALSVVMVIVAR